jgi:tetratricopeptide repeat protein 30
VGNKFEFVMDIDLTTSGLTQRVYTLIQEVKYKEGAQLLSKIRVQYPNSRAALSLLAFCYYQGEDFLKASEMFLILFK